MNAHHFTLAGAHLHARPSGGLFWPDASILCVSDLHLGKSERIARKGGGLLPPFETADTLMRLADEIAATNPETVICLGDSFDDLMAAELLDDTHRTTLSGLQAGRRWIWIEGNHDPGPVELGGSHQGEFSLAPLTFRHIAVPGANGEISGHYHPKAKLSLKGGAISRPCFLWDGKRLILPAFGTYTGGLSWTDKAFDGLFLPKATAFLTGRQITALPVPRSKAKT